MTYTDKTIYFMENQYHTRCLSCDSKKLSHLSNFYPQMLVKCNDCSLVFDERIPSQLTLSQHYATYSYSRRKPVSIGTQHSINELLNQFECYRNTNNILDVGCGQGDFLITAKQRGWNVYGSEYSPAAVKLCEDSSIVMHQGEYHPEVFGNITFDIVTSFEVLEHTYSPHTLITASLSNLRSGGLFYLTTPNFNSLLRHFEKKHFKVLDYPEHLSLYTPRSLKKLLEKYPINCDKILTTGIDITRLKATMFRQKLSKIEDEIGSKENSVSNESIRAALASEKGKHFKSIANKLLTLLGKGDTLKAYCVKK